MLVGENNCRRQDAVYRSLLILEEAFVFLWRKRKLMSLKVILKTDLRYIQFRVVVNFPFFCTLVAKMFFFHLEGNLWLKEISAETWELFTRAFSLFFKLKITSTERSLPANNMAHWVYRTLVHRGPSTLWIRRLEYWALKQAQTNRLLAGLTSLALEDGPCVPGGTLSWHVLQ